MLGGSCRAVLRKSRTARRDPFRNSLYQTSRAFQPWPALPQLARGPREIAPSVEQRLPALHFPLRLLLLPFRSAIVPQPDWFQTVARGQIPAARLAHTIGRLVPLAFPWTPARRKCLKSV